VDLACFFGMAGSHNDINVLQHSSVFARHTKGHALPVNYVINGHTYTKCYNLAGGICPQWSAIVKIIRGPYLENKAWFANCQESCRNNVERAFGVLQQHFAIIRYTAFQWSTTQLV
jgi:hypothetical protein